MKPFLVGITGNIGGGKSTLLKYLKNIGFFVINSDEVAKRVLYTKEHKDILISILGNTIINENNDYDFGEIRKILFSDPDKKSMLEQFGSTIIWQEIESVVKTSGKLIVFIENAVLFEQNWGNYFNLIVCSYCNEEEAIRRVTESRKLTIKDVEKIIAEQLPISVKIKMSDISIDTTYFENDHGKKHFETLLQKLKAEYPAPFHD